MNKNNNKPPIQFTELTLDDVMIHEDIYIALLLSNKSTSVGEKGTELMKAKRMFYEAFK